MIQIHNVNLLGDCLYTLRPIAELHMQHPHEQIRIGVAGEGFAAQMVRQQFEPMLRVVDAGTLSGTVIDLGAGHCADAIEQVMLMDHNRRPHISEGFAWLLGVKTDHWLGVPAPLTGWARVWTNKPVDDVPYAIIAPFSKSCSRNHGLRPNKTPNHDKWTGVIEWLREERGLEPCVLVAPGEVWTGVKCEMIEALNLDALTNILNNASLVISVDNGVAHMASALRRRVLILWPPMSAIHFIAPVYNDRTKLLLMHPERIRAEQLLRLIMNEEKTI
jgi:hypothetical protein